MQALQVMMTTYQQNPQFGDTKKFQGELDTASHRAQALDSELAALRHRRPHIERTAMQTNKIEQN